MIAAVTPSVSPTIDTAIVLPVCGVPARRARRPAIPPAIATAATPASPSRNIGPRHPTGKIATTMSVATNISTEAAVNRNARTEASISGRILGGRRRYPAHVNPALGWTLIAIGVLLVVITWLWLQYSVSQMVADLLTVVAGLMAALGGLLILTDVNLVSWVVAPALVGFGTWLHRRVLFHGAGPLRT